MQQIAFLTKKTNCHTTIYAVFALVVSTAFFFAGVVGIMRSARLGNIGLEVTCILIGAVFGLLALWVFWVMRHEIIGLEVDEQGRIEIVSQWRGLRHNVQPISRLFTFGCIRFGAPNDGRMDYVVVNTSDGIVAIPTELYDRINPKVPESN